LAANKLRVAVYTLFVMNRIEKAEKLFSLDEARATRAAREDRARNFTAFLQGLEAIGDSAFIQELQNSSLSGLLSRVQAERILEAAELRGAGGPQRPKPIGLAAKIVEAGIKRRHLSDGNA
jgi:hypothetical protein